MELGGHDWVQRPTNIMASAAFYIVQMFYHSTCSLQNWGFSISFNLDIQKDVLYGG